ncbi:signal transduction histidine kinase [Frankia casuarinae]|uniref:histidine kinase n=2 Tax=Frankiaceae TaxID=74712 RepID=Q2JGG8_FRACC|nr:MULTISPECIES: HAMP domain-containing sensor histidine kinase [Frankia]ABD09624.1 periplasmic sensor signal transduction histidine kinase [Frankia casuarinae]ETA03673.1 signal transduction histidine kinase [Frankia sp. CcI6]EYT93657.1 signal transduction histidine kinase [Frankia casuarinae]KDA43878.1 signal transduction histidine kinase [Frankia sp. BMG5.23]OAA27327.1 two-component system, OmpR family, sensor kinase [Frankia casuarinae]
MSRPVLSLRARLLLALVGLLAVGMALGAVGTRGALGAYLRGRLDQQVRDAHPLMEQLLLRAGGDGDGDDHYPGFGTTFLVGTYGALYDGAGRRLAEASPGPGGPGGPGGPAAPTQRPAVSARLLATARLHPDLATVPLCTVGAEDHGGRFRMLAERFDNGYVLIVAVPFAEVNATLDRVTRIEVVATSVVTAALAVLAYVIIRLGLRPLTRIEQTADLIAHGDLTRRVADADRRTEVGRLGLAFNAMLTRIEAAFRAREVSEGRLRRFVGDASHELRTPLTSIRGYAEMFHRGAAERPEDLAMVMRRIEEESARMSELVDDLLLLARLDQRPVLERQPVDVAAMVRDIVTDARVVSPGRTIEVDVPPILEVLGDEGRLRQAVGNLVRNAVVHTPPDAGISVSVGPLEAGSPGPTGDGPTDGIVVSVVDHGPGVPEDAVAHLFERFFRADAGRSRDAGGTGLGLSIVDAVATAHGGRVEYRPTPGGGATFRLVLPGPSQPD